MMVIDIIQYQTGSWESMHFIFTVTFISIPSIAVLTMFRPLYPPDFFRFHPLFTVTSPAVSFIFNQYDEVAVSHYAFYEKGITMNSP